MNKLIKIMKEVEEFIMGSVDKRSGDDRRKKRPRKRKNEKRSNLEVKSCVANVSQKNGRLSGYRNIRHGTK